MDYSTVQTRVLNRLNSSSTDPIALVVDEYTNEALHYLEMAAPQGWPWMRGTYSLSLTSGTATYAFSTISSSPVLAKINEVRFLNGTTYVPLKLLSFEEAHQLYPVTTSGLPEAWSTEGRTLYIWPTPSANYTASVRAVFTETDLGGSTSTPTLPVVYHSAWVEQTLLLVYETLQDDAKMEMTQKRLNRLLTDMRTHGYEHAGGTGVRVRDWLG